ncbi:MAG TPA: MBL fold metallo-hydrolase [Candidatus Bathyarchaeia archaeon]|nr:MBL fold metallo-hydrolase [Candidatus Bathyarchaeia archaeon]
MRHLTRPLLLAVLLTACAAVGTERVATGPSHHVEGGFRNVDSGIQRASGFTRFKFMWSRAWAPARTSDVPRIANDGAALRANGSDPTVTWIGHATVLVQLDGTNLLTDPHWGERASPLSWAGPKRLQPPGLAFEDLPPIHVVLISHDHYDHLDLGTVKRLAAAHDPVFVVGLGLKAWFAEQGISRVVELDWWESFEHRGLRIVCTPAQHFSQRSPWDSNTRLWASWAVVGTSRRFYFSGDTGYFDGFREIGERLGPFDLTAMAIGAYKPASIMRFVHLTPEQAVQAHADLRGATLLGMHWGTFDLAEEPLDEPPQRMLAEAARRNVPADQAWIVKLGETRRW